jgi:hypothetical protein
MREFFTRHEDNQEVIIETDLNAYAYSQKFGWLLSVFIKFDAKDETQEGFEEFLETKESLIIALEHDEGAKYVGGRVVDGWSELYFYTRNSKGLNQQVAQILKERSYIFETHIVKDTKWDFHHKNLTPSELELCHIQSDKIIFMLQEEGDTLEIPRDVEHYLSFDTATQKQRFLEHLDLEGFSFKDEISGDEFENGIALVKKHAVTRKSVAQEVQTLFDAVKKEHGYYEGWSTLLVTSETEE